MLPIKSKAVDFTLKNQDGEDISLSNYKGKKVVLYFYPKDMTSGCTMQAIAFQELREQFEKENAVIMGISKDSVSSHRKFADKYGLEFNLLSDPEGKVLDAYGAWQEKSMYGRKYFGIVRTTYVIDEDGFIVSAEEKVKAKENPSCTLNIIKK